MKIYKFVKSGHTVKSYKSINNINNINNQTPKSKSAKLKNLFLMGSPVLISSIGFNETRKRIKINKKER